MSRRIFTDDWRDCLREQYKSVIRQQDKRTEATLTEVLYEVGFTQDELAALRFEASLRAEDMPDDFVPEEVAQQVYAGVDAPAEPVLEPAAELSAEAEMQAVEEDAEDAEPELLDELPVESDMTDDDLPDAADGDADQPQQLSLF
jgi:hypothetical protein